MKGTERVAQERMMEKRFKANRMSSERNRKIESGDRAQMKLGEQLAQEKSK